MRDIFREIRLHQWSKNLLVFAPLIMAHQVFEPKTAAFAFFSFFAFSLSASAGYVLNDLLDLEADRRHPQKRNRPLASGRMGTRTAWILIAVLLIGGMAFAWRLPPSFLVVLFGYLVSTVLYSLVIKKIALLDVLFLAALYTIRIFAGSTATGIPVSEWLLAFAMFLFLSLALAKRFTELKLLADQGPRALNGRGYSDADLDYVPIMGITSGFLTSLVMALYVSSDHVRSLYAHPQYLWLICPLILYWISRVWLVCHRGKMHEDPVVFALRDRVSFIVVALGLVIMAFAS
jgi:4-hydroxybenzoate polyprenyltransferase